MSNDAVAARLAVKHAIERGQLAPANACEMCGATVADHRGNRLHGHHWHGYDVEHQLDVQWLCLSCHMHAHAGRAKNRPSPTRHYGPRGYLSISEAARRLGVSRGTVYRMIQRGELPKQTVALRDYVREYDVEVFSTTKLAAQVSTGVVLELLDLIDRHPELGAQLRTLVDQGGTS